MNTHAKEDVGSKRDKAKIVKLPVEKKTRTSRAKPNKNSATANLPVKADNDKRFDGEAAELSQQTESSNDTNNLKNMTGDTTSCTTTPTCTTNGALDTSTLKNNASQPIAARVALLETNVDRLNTRQSYQEHLHRNVREDGNITHYYNIVPTVIISAGVGAVLGFSINALLGFVKRKMAK